MTQAMAPVRCPQLTRHIVDGYARGASLTQLSEDVGRSYGFVRRVLLDVGITLRPRGGHHPRTS